MRLNDIMNLLEAEPLNQKGDFPIDVQCAFASDLMSDVLALAKPGSLLITGLINIQIMRTASMIDMPAVVFVRGEKPHEETIELAGKLGIPFVLDFEAASSFEKWVRNLLPPVENRSESFGYQLVIDKDDKILEQASYLLLQGIEATADEVLLKTREHGGASILTHIDRLVYSYLAVLGLVPDDLQVDAVEFSGGLSREKALKWKVEAGGRTIIRSSDAHRLSDLSRDRTTVFRLERPSFEEIVLALGNGRGRTVFWPWEQSPPAVD